MSSFGASHALLESLLQHAQLLERQGNAWEANFFYRRGLSAALELHAAVYQFKFRLALANLKAHQHEWLESSDFLEAARTQLAELLAQGSAPPLGQLALVRIELSLHTLQQDFDAALRTLDAAADVVDSPPKPMDQVLLQRLSLTSSTAATASKSSKSKKSVKSSSTGTGAASEAIPLSPMAPSKVRAKSAKQGDSAPAADVGDLLAQAALLQLHTGHVMDTSALAERALAHSTSPETRARTHLALAKILLMTVAVSDGDDNDDVDIAELTDKLSKVSVTKAKRAGKASQVSKVSKASSAGKITKAATKTPKSAASSASMSSGELAKLKVIDLKAMLKNASLPTSGKKQELIDRLEEHFAASADNDDDDDAEEESICDSVDDACDSDAEMTDAPANLEQPAGSGTKLQATMHLRKALEEVLRTPNPSLQREICQLLASALAQQDPGEAAALLHISFGLTYAQTSITARLERTIRKHPSCLPAMHPAAPSAAFVEHLAQAIDSLPSHIAVTALCHLESTNELLASRVEQGQAPIMLRISLASGSFKQALDEFRHIIQSNEAIIKGRTSAANDREAWWKERLELESQLAAHLEDLEQRIMGPAALLLLGLPKEKKLRSMLDKAANSASSDVQPLSLAMARLCLNALTLCDGQNSAETLVRALLQHQFGDESIVSAAMAALAKHQKTLRGKFPQAFDAAPVCLALDRILQELPLESMPLLRSRSIYRVPSLAFVTEQLDARKEALPSINPLKAWFVLNPSGDLGQTQERLEKLFESNGWTGVAGRPPTMAELQTELASQELYVYCGHGSSEKLLPRTKLRAMTCRAAVLLMGCSSGLLQPMGVFDPCGMALEFLSAGSPAVVANLWDVTDGDIDRFCQQVVGEMMDSISGSRDLGSIIANCRSVCKCKYLVGAAPVVYGLPSTVECQQ
eukprot:m.55550 g.55550  ORF g.55550 m.55550 type:complete len:925 (+) comp6941_c0_seq2:107-2881(+)